MNNNKHFIFTSDAETAKNLEREGFICVEKGRNGKYWKFLNDWSKQNFNESIDESKIKYTNIISV